MSDNIAYCNSYSAPKGYNSHECSTVICCLGFLCMAFFVGFFLNFILHIWWKLLLTRKRPWNWSITARMHGQTSDKRKTAIAEGKENSNLLKTCSNSFELSKTIFKSFSEAGRNVCEFYPQSSDTHYLKYLSTFLGSSQGRWKCIHPIHPAPRAASAHWRCVTCSRQICPSTVCEPVLTFGSKNDLKLGKKHCVPLCK